MAYSKLESFMSRFKTTVSQFSVRTSLTIITLASIAFFFDTIVFSNEAYAITFAECFAYSAYACWYFWFYRDKRLKSPSFFLFLASCFGLIGDIGFASQYYFHLHDIEWLSVCSITVPGTFGAMFIVSAQLLLLRPLFSQLFAERKIYLLLVPFAIVLIFLAISHLLFIENFVAKYGAIQQSYFNIFRIGIVELGAIAAGLGVVCLCFTNNPAISLLGLGVFLKILGDWSMRLKEYLSMSALLGVGEYIFFAGISLMVAGGYILSDDDKSKAHFGANMIASAERLSLILPMLVLCLASAAFYNNNAEIIELLFLAGCILSVGIFRSTLVTSEYIEKFRNYIARRKDKEALEALELPYELEELRSAFDARIVDFAKSEAIAQTIQYLAHDVRRPFSMIRVGLEVLSCCETQESLKKTVSMLLPSVKNAIVSVDNMLEDILEASREAQLILEVVSLESVIAKALADTVSVVANKNVSFTYSFQHPFDPLVDEERLGRVFINIIANALQAIPVGEKIWFASRNIPGQNMLMLTIGNSGSFIPDTKMKEIFKTYFSSGKKGGTGLGLAIAKKVVEQHNGTISCTSQPSPPYVEFHITLPMSCEPARSSAGLFASSNDYEINAKVTKDASHENKEVKILQERIRRRVERLGRALEICIVDDDAIYRNGINEMIGNDETLRNIILIREFDSTETLPKKLAGLDYLICDIDFAPGQQSGFDLLEKYIGVERDFSICIHSNRNLSVDLERIVKLGADYILPKPMSRLHLLKFLCSKGGND